MTSLTSTPPRWRLPFGPGAEQVLIQELLRQTAAKPVPGVRAHLRHVAKAYGFTLAEIAALQAEGRCRRA